MGVLSLGKMLVGGVSVERASAAPTAMHQCVATVQRSRVFGPKSLERGACYSEVTSGAFHSTYPYKAKSCHASIHPNTCPCTSTLYPSYHTDEMSLTLSPAREENFNNRSYFNVVRTRTWPHRPYEQLVDENNCYSKHQQSSAGQLFVSVLQGSEMTDQKILHLPRVPRPPGFS